MSALNLAPNMQQHDDLYEALIRMHDGLTADESLKLWSRLALILMNHIGNPAVIQSARKTSS